MRFKFCIWAVAFLLNIRDQVLLARVIIDSNPEEYGRQIATSQASEMPR